MLRSMYAGVSGMKSNQTKMDVIGNNIANVGTTAFKSGRVRFQDMLSQTQANAQAPIQGGQGGTNPQQIGLGVEVAAIDTIFDGGSMQPTGRDLDFAIEGNGFFIVSEDPNGQMKQYTRDGAFFKDYEGNLVNANGLRVFGYKPAGGVDYTQDMGEIDNAVIANLQPISIPKDIVVPDQYEEDEDAAGNGLFATTDISGTNFTSSIGIGTYQGENGEITIRLGDDFSGTNGVYSGTVEVTYIDGDTEKFDLNGGDTITARGLNIVLDGNLTNANKNQMFTTEISGMVPATHKQISLETYSIDASGLISAVYDDGEVYYLGRLAMANFDNPGGLEKLGGNAYGASRNSGPVQVGNPGQDGFGSIRQGNLEMSNVDLANEFTEMISTSRAYQANSRIITTSDEMLQELINLKR